MRFPREAEGVKCDCGGYADKVETTHEENMEYDCGRYQRRFLSTGEKSRYVCCAVAFVCAVCGKRLVGTQDSPEIN